jgi:hypothetical protein
MPLTKTGDKVLRSMKAGYGAKRGSAVFYASAFNHFRVPFFLVLSVKLYRQFS